MHRSMGKGPLIFVLDKARFPYDLVKAAVDRCRSRMRLDMALSQKFDNLLGILGAGAFFIGVVVFVMAPFLIVPAVFALVFPGCSLDSPWTWQTVIVGGLVLFALGIGVSLLMGVLARVIAPLGHLVVNKVTKEILEFLVLWWIYFTLMQPVSYAFGASVMVTIVTAAADRNPYHHLAPITDLRPQLRRTRLLGCNNGSHAASRSRSIPRRCRRVARRFRSPDWHSSGTAGTIAVLAGWHAARPDRVRY